LEGTARELLGQAEAEADPEERNAREEAEGFLSGMLADRPLPAKQIQREAREAGHSERTLWRAKKALGVEARKEGVGAWLWHLPPGKAAKTATLPCLENLAENRPDIGTLPPDRGASLPKAAASLPSPKHGSLGSLCQDGAPEADPAEVEL
jgi:hypothetical protein